MWQELREELYPKGFEIVTVALDTGGAEVARPYVEAAGSRHPPLVDVRHLLDALLGIVNVPEAVWIDEEGLLVRPPETAAPQSMTAMLPNVELPPDTPPRVVAMMEEAYKIQNDAEAYVAALRDWVERGAESPYALAPDEVVRRSRPGHRRSLPPRPRASSSPSICTVRATPTTRCAGSARRTACNRTTGRTGGRRGSSPTRC